MVLLSIFFTRIRSTEDHQQIVLYSFCRSMRLPSILAVKKIFKSFCMKIWARCLTYIFVGCISSRMPAGPHFVTQPILIRKTFPIFDINHQQTQGAVESDQTEMIKTITQPRALVSHGRFYQMLVAVIFKEIFDHKEKISDCELFWLWTKTTIECSCIIFTIWNIV